MRLILMFFFLYVGTVNVQAATVQKSVVVKQPIILKKDSSQVKPRQFNEAAIKEYRKQKEFIYDDVAPPTQSWWTKFWTWIWKMITNLFGNKATGGVLKYILMFLVIGIIVFVVIKLIGIDFKLLTGRSKAVAIPYEESLENIHEINFDEQLEQALLNKNYRLAVRLLYLKTLKNLSDQQLIDWQLEKTNQTYVSELKNESQQQEFTKLTNQFEYIWYGEFMIDQLLFEPINQSFQQFNLSAK